jgi:hypothetical protein
LTETCTLTVQRTSPLDVMERQIVVSLDGERIAELLYGKSVTRTIAPGPHRLRIHNTLVWKTVAFEAHPGEHVRFQTVNHAPSWAKWMVGLLGAGPMYVTVERESVPSGSQPVS